MSVERKETKGRYPGVIIAETDTIESKKEIMKNKSKLKHIIIPHILIIINRLI